MALKIHKGISPIKVPENEKIVSIAFPSGTSSITSLDIPETATIDVSACSESTQDTIRLHYKTTNNVSTSKTWVTYKDGTEKSINIKGKLDGYKGGYTPDREEIYYMSSIVFGNDWDKIINVNLGQDVSEIGYGAFGEKRVFEGYNQITTPTAILSVIIPNSVTSIGSNAFYKCSGLTSITIPDSVTSIGKNTFWGCSGLTSVTIGNGVTSIGEHAFRYCSGLTSITIPDSVTSIGEGAFRNCSGLTSITIPDSVTSISSWAFDGCSGLTSITFKGTIAQWNAITKSNYWKDGVPATCKVYCTNGTISI